MVAKLHATAISVLDNLSVIVLCVTAVGTVLPWAIDTSNNLSQVFIQAVGDKVVCQLILEHIARYYARQLSQKIQSSSDLLTRFENLLKRYYDERGENGFDYAYRFPGINKVQQSAGRVIRTAEDRGVILLLDSRLLTAGYRRLFPLEWSDAEETEISSVWEQLTEFWSDSPQGL